MQARIARHQPHQNRGRQAANHRAQRNLHGPGVEHNNLQQGTGRGAVRETDNIRRAQGVTRNHLEDRTRKAQRSTHQKGRHDARRTLLGKGHRNRLALAQKRRNNFLGGELVVTLQHAPEGQRSDSHHQDYVQDDHAPRNLRAERPTQGQNGTTAQVAAAARIPRPGSRGNSSRGNSRRGARRNRTIRHQSASTLRRVIRNRKTGAPARVATIPACVSCGATSTRARISAPSSHTGPSRAEP